MKIKVRQFANFFNKLRKPMATRSENPIDGMYKIRSAMTNPTLMMPHAGKNGTTIKDSAMRIFLKKNFMNQSCRVTWWTFNSLSLNSRVNCCDHEHVKYCNEPNPKITEALNQFDRIKAPVKAQPIWHDEKKKIKDVKIVLSQNSRMLVISECNRVVFTSEHWTLKVLYT